MNAILRIPDFVKKTPWYSKSKNSHEIPDKNAESPKEKPEDNTFNYIKENFHESKHLGKRYRKGACENCGSMSHKKRDCLERPRSKRNTAQMLNKTLAADDLYQTSQKKENKKSYDTSRDRWNGYDPSSHISRVENFYSTVVQEPEVNLEEVQDKDELKFKLGTGDRLEVHNLRIREDTAEYLKTLDTKIEDQKKEENLQFTLVRDGMNKASSSGLENSQVFAWDLDSRKQQVEQVQEQRRRQNEENAGLRINPREVQRLKKQHQESQQRAFNLGNRAEKRIDASEVIEREVWGELNKMEFNQKREMRKSSHSSVFGSFYNKAEEKWGYACCYQTLRNAFCTGEEGRKAIAESIARQLQIPDKPSVNILEKNREKFNKNLADRRKQAGVLNSISKDSQKREQMFMSKHLREEAESAASSKQREKDKLREDPMSGFYSGN
eukprot:snap_masked-scaffold_13-processed-gene-8.44-mRNA-1 protein AED:0.21 eAED:0.21 QI:0/-1/0/1/-1/1/1/0/438